jgi:N-acetylglucosaminyl-diphospho-decaprenol L-rhamnosyltransferase
MPPLARTTVITVTYNSAVDLPDMLASIPAGFPTIIVDNASADRDALRPLCARFGAQLLENAENTGFGRGCNAGAARAETEFLLFLNPDASLAPDTIAELESAADRYPKVSAMNPRIANADGSAFFKRRSTLLPKSQWMPRGSPTADAAVSVLSGAALFVRRADFQAVGGFDPAIFLFHEDDDLSLRLAQARGPLMFIHTALVRHIGGRTTDDSPASARFKAFHYARSRVYTARKHSRPQPFLRALLYASRNLLAPDMLFSARRRAKNWGYFKGVLSTLRDGGLA